MDDSSTVFVLNIVIILIWFYNFMFFLACHSFQQKVIEF